MRVIKKILKVLFNRDKSQLLARIDEQSKIKFERHYNDFGKFIYEDDGFLFNFDYPEQKIKWNDIERLVGYKADLFTIDEIRMDIVYNNYQITISEETPGWYQFLEKIKSIFSTIPKDWDTEIIQPPFQTNCMILYEPENRVLPRENNFYASFYNVSKTKIKDIFELNNWTCRKESWNDFEFRNSWTELILEGEDNKPLLNGMVAYHQDNLQALNKIFNSLEVQYRYEFYDEKKNVIFEMESPT